MIRIPSFHLCHHDFVIIGRRFVREERTHVLLLLLPSSTSLTRVVSDIIAG
jgi:hypothetical protein